MNGPGLPASGPIDPGCGGILLIPGAMGTVDPEDTGPDAVTTQLLQAKETELMPLVRQAMRKEKMTVATVCGGSMLLAMDGRLVTGGGVTSGLDVALYLVERELGPRISHAVEKLFEYERRGTVWTDAGLLPVQTRQQRDPEEAALDGAPPEAEEGAAASAFDGTWDLAISTPVGKFAMVMTVFTRNGVLHGTFQEGGQWSDLMEPRIRNGEMTWSLHINKPMRLHLKFAVAAVGDRLSGTAKAGLLPSSRVEGIRRRPVS